MCEVVCVCVRGGGEGERERVHGMPCEFSRMCEKSLF